MNGNLSYYIGYYSPTIIGGLLLVYGIRANYLGLETELILHSKSKKAHSVIKWIGFALSALLFASDLFAVIDNWLSFDIFTLLTMVGALALLVYTLFYMYKKPSCLFSAAMIFVGSAYIYGIISSIPYYILRLSNADYALSYIFMGILPTFAVGILYIVSAVLLYKEDYSVKIIKSLGYTILALEILSNVVGNTIIYQSILAAILIAIPNLWFAVVVMLYMSVLKINSLRDMPVTTEPECAVAGNIFREIVMPEGGWKCECGRVHQKYETSCICGKTKIESQKHNVIEQ